MAKDRDRLTKILTLAVHPQTVPQEALAAFRRARDLVKANPSLAHPPEAKKPQPIPEQLPQATFKAKITSVHPDWVLILTESLSNKAYDLNLKSKITFDFTQRLTTINVLCDGGDDACTAFGKHVEWAIDYANKKLEESRKR